MEQNMTPFISVIVPIYNVEKYVRTCLDSLRSQTLKEIEVIMIDDNSTDKSGMIANEYVTKPGVRPEFRLIRNKKNRGLSAARNTGIDETVADWIMFVDSDDWVEPGFCEIPYKVAVENGADLVIFQNYETVEDGRVKRKRQKLIHSGFLNHETAIDIGGSQAWNKLYKKEIFKNHRYPEGHVYEDYAITHQLVYQAKCIVSVSDWLYYYRYRKSSICHSISGEKDRLAFSKRRYRELSDLGYPENKAKVQLLGAALRCCGRANMKSAIYVEASELLNSIHVKSEGYSAKDKLLIMLWRFSKRLYSFTYRSYLSVMKYSE